MPAFYRRQAALAQPMLPQSEQVWVESLSLTTGNAAYRMTRDHLLRVRLSALSTVIRFPLREGNGSA
jgi:hypothetical protein